jgi:ankyrin repeat protein
MQYILSLILFFSFISTSIGVESSSIKDSYTPNILVTEQQTKNSDESEIIKACLQGDLSSFLTKFEKNNQIINNILNEENEPLIISAVKGGNYKIVKALIDHGIDIHSLSKNKNTPLHLASFYGRYKIVELLIEHGADVHKKGNLGYTPICDAAQKGYDEIIQLLINRGANLEHQDIYGRTPLLLAAGFSNKESAVSDMLPSLKEGAS